MPSPSRYQDGQEDPLLPSASAPVFFVDHSELPGGESSSPQQQSPPLHPSSSSPSSSPKSLSHRLGLALFAVLQNALAGGIVFGWASIDATLLQASESNGGAALTQAQTTQLFAFGSSTAMLATLALGPVLDAQGPRSCLLLSQASVALGCFAFGHAQDGLWQFALAVILMAFGGPGVGISIIHLANLFPKQQFLVLSCVSGSVTLSFAVLAVLERIWEWSQVSFRVLFSGYSGVIILLMVATAVLSPDDPYELLEEEEDGESQVEDEHGHHHHQHHPLGTQHHRHQSFESFFLLLQDSPPADHPTLEREYVEANLQAYAHHHQNHLWLADQSLSSNLRREEEVAGLESDDEEAAANHGLTRHQSHNHTNRRILLHKSASFMQSQQVLESGNQAALPYISLKDQPFAQQVQSPTFGRACIIFVITSFFANFTIASLSTELADLPALQALVQQHPQLAQQFTAIMSAGLLSSLLVGCLMDKWGLEVCTIVTLVLGQASTVLMLIPSYAGMAHSPWQYPIMMTGITLYTLFRQFLFPVFLAYLTARLGFKYFGMLSGIGFALAGVAQMFMADVVRWVHVATCSSECSHWHVFHLVQLVVLGLLIAIPIADHRDIQRREEQLEQALQMQQQQLVKGSPRSTASTVTSRSSPLLPPGRPHRLMVMVAEDGTYYDAGLGTPPDRQDSPDYGSMMV